jgi:glycosyltransferase involved in cell wall biosynthesis
MTISVVMSVYNGASRLRPTMESLLGQTDRDFELIVVDDGSTDGTPAMLASYAALDPRVRIITQSNSGLTRALIRGCSEARGRLIARQDCGDQSHPERLARQRALIDSAADIVLVSCSTAYRGPEGELLYEVSGQGEEVRQSLLRDGVDSVRGLTHHGSAMFRREAYQQAGGYRAAFYFAQDLDLWTRLARLGRIALLPEVLYDAVIEPRAISANYREQQIESATLSLALRDERLSESDRRKLLDRASAIRPHRRPSVRRDEASALYFIANCLRRNGDVRWRGYALAALRSNAFHLRSWLLLLRGRT